MACCTITATEVEKIWCDQRADVEFLQETPQSPQPQRNRVSPVKLRSRRANKVRHLGHLIHLVPKEVMLPKPKTDLDERGRQQGHDLTHTSSKFGTGIAPRPFPWTGIYA